jgi:hypothetical protein
MTFLLLVSLLSPSADAANSRSRLPAAEPELISALEVPAAETPMMAAPPSATSRTTLSKLKSVPAIREKRTSILLPSIVVHGFAIDKEVADQMPRKLDNGQTVATPGVGIEYVTPGGFLVLGGMLKDCYDNLAGLIQIGQRFKVASATSVGYSLGIYARETPIACKTTTNRFGRRTTTCDEFDNYQLKWMTRVNGEDVDVIPMPFLHFTTALYRDRDIEIDFKFMSNFALNEFGLSIPF